MNFEERESSGLAVFFGVIIVILVLIGVVSLFGMFGTVDTGYRGIVVRLQNPTGEVKEQGFYTKTPFVEDVIEMTVQTQKEEVNAGAASKDLQDVSTKVALIYSLDEKSLVKTYQEVRQDWASRLVQPALQESIKAATAKYTAEELISRRDDVKAAIKANVVDRLQPRGIIVEDVNIINFEFSSSFNRSIEAKVSAEQDALASKNRLEQVKYEAQQAVEKARGDAEAARIVSTQPQYLELKALEKWDGRLPLSTNGATPFLNLQ